MPDQGLAASTATADGFANNVQAKHQDTLSAGACPIIRLFDNLPSKNEASKDCCRCQSVQAPHTQAADLSEGSNSQGSGPEHWRWLSEGVAANWPDVAAHYAAGMEMVQLIVAGCGAFLTPKAISGQRTCISLPPG